MVALGDRAVPDLEALLRGPSESIHEPRCLAGDALGLISGRAAADALLRALTDSLARTLDPVLRQAETAVVNCIADNLGPTRDPRAADALLDALATRPHVGCVRALARLHEPRAIPLLVTCLDDDVAREAAADAIRAFGRDAQSDLVRALSRPRLEHGVEGPSRIAGRAMAATLLGEMGGDEARSCLARAVLDGQREVRLAAAIALADRGRQEDLGPALPVLVDGLGDADLVRADRAAEAIDRIGPDAADALVAAITRVPASPEARRRAAWAVELLGRLALPRASARLAALAPLADGRLRLAIVRALAGTPGREATAALRALADDPDPVVRGRVVETLARRDGGLSGDGDS